MANYQVLWNAAANQRDKLQPKGKNQTTAVKGSGFTLPAGASKPAAISYQNTALPQAPLDSLINQISSNVQTAVSKSSFTNTLDLGSVFKSAFAMTGYQQTAPATTPEIVAQQTTSLVKGIFQKATAANSDMTQIQKTQLFSSLLNGVNIGFATAKTALQSSGQATQEDIDKLDRTQELTRQSLYAYYSTLNNTPVPQAQPQPAAGPTPQATQTAPTPQNMASASQAYSGQTIVTPAIPQTAGGNAGVAAAYTATAVSNTQTSSANPAVSDLTYRFNAVLAYVNVPYIPGSNAAA